MKNMKNMKNRKPLLPIFAMLLLFITYNSHAQTIFAKPIQPSSLPDGVAMEVLSEAMIRMNLEDPQRYFDFVSHFFEFSDVEIDQLLMVSGRMVDESKRYAQSQLEARCNDGSFRRIRDGNNIDAILQSLEGIGKIHMHNKRVHLSAFCGKNSAFSRYRGFWTGYHVILSQAYL